MLSAPEPTDVAKAFATSLAPKESFRNHTGQLHHRTCASSRGPRGPRAAVRIFSKASLTDSEGGEERQETAANAHPFELLGFGGTSEKLARSLSERFSGAHGTTR